MVFSKIFGKQPPPASAPPANEPPAVEAGEDADAPAGDDGSDAPESWAARARRVIVGGASTGSKRAENLYGGAAEEPTHFVRAAGCHVETADGERLLDCTMALGAVALGYGEPQLTRAVIETIANGSVSGLSPTLEVEVAERLCGVVACAERVQFLKTGAEAMTAAVRIARTYTARDIVVGCGYFGWHDWSSDSAGVSAVTKQQFMRVPFDDIAALERAVADAGSGLAAIALEPVIERLPSPEWIATARALCDTRGAVLIFDEMKTGFRLATGGYQQFAGVTPDLAAFGKALANGYPLAVVCGHAALMEAAERTWISSTLASESAALVAAASVLSWHDRVDVCASLADIGKEMRGVVAAALEASGVTGVTMAGIDPMWFLRFDSGEKETEFLGAAVRNGVLFKRGAYNFAALAHDDDAIRDIESAASAAFVELREREER
jgi:glutamate-1-semialdehyde 2,1-aminomutase